MVAEHIIQVRMDRIFYRQFFSWLWRTISFILQILISFKMCFKYLCFIANYYLKSNVQYLTWINIFKRLLSSYATLPSFPQNNLSSYLTDFQKIFIIYMGDSFLAKVNDILELFKIYFNVLNVIFMKLINYLCRENTLNISCHCNVERKLSLLKATILSKNFSWLSPITLLK